MSKATTLTDAAAALIGHSAEVGSCLRRDRDWLWLVGDYKDDPETRTVLKDTGYRFSKGGHDLEESGEKAHWYFGLSANGKGRRNKAKASRAASKATGDTVKAITGSAEVNPELYGQADEFDNMFG